MTIHVIAYGAKAHDSRDEALMRNYLQPKIDPNKNLSLHTTSTDRQSFRNLINRTVHEGDTLGIIAASPESAVALANTLRSKDVQKTLTDRTQAIYLAAPPMDYRLDQSHSQAFTTEAKNLNTINPQNLKSLANLLKASYYTKPLKLDATKWCEVTSPRSIFVPGFTNEGKNQIDGFKVYDHLSDFLPFIDKMISLANNDQTVRQGDQLLQSPLSGTLAAI